MAEYGYFLPSYIYIGTYTFPTGVYPLGNVSQTSWKYYTTCSITVPTFFKKVYMYGVIHYV